MRKYNKNIIYHISQNASGPIIYASNLDNYVDTKGDDYDDTTQESIVDCALRVSEDKTSMLNGRRVRYGRVNTRKRCWLLQLLEWML